ncbi:hypothetical protein B0H17DRAFT_1181291 [Mycena rosella]|uniref:Uncharacterized protein n=1 Tax=Mycena rosella TaxID=1033263 RepID=A0AAD7D9I6_MYCRO|nr:hypothetical protein B0H17DRAFT_1181291 [Mycena rosella]
MSSSSTTTSMPSRPAFARSKTMPAFRRAFTLPLLGKPLASICASSSRGLRRMPTLRTPKASDASSATIRPSASIDSIVVFTTPDYEEAAALGPPPPAEISPLTVPRPSFTRAMTLPAPVRALHSATLLKLPIFNKVVCETSRKASGDSVESVSSGSSTATTSTSSSARRRFSSSTTVESFSSSQDRLTLGLCLRAFPSTVMGIFASIMAVLVIFFLPEMAAETPRRVPAPQPYERKITMSEEQERNPPKLRKSTPASRLSRRVAKAYRRTLRRVVRARRASTPSEALAVLFAPTTKRPRASTPAPVDPSTLVTDVPIIVYSSPIALPLPKGPAPAVRPARKVRRVAVLPTVREEEALDDALCPGW